MFVVKNTKNPKIKNKIIKCKKCKSKLMISREDLIECTGNLIGYETTCPVCNTKLWLNVLTGKKLGFKI